VRRARVARFPCARASLCATRSGMSSITQAFSKKHALITGGSQGIGLALAESLAAVGTELTLVARRKGPLESAAAELRVRFPECVIHTCVCDVSNAETVHAVLVPHAVAHPVDVIVNNAGVVVPGKALDQTRSVHRQHMEVNYWGAFQVCEALLPGMIARGQGGHVVNVGSLLSVMGIFGYGAYCASKFALYGFSECLRAELWPHGIRVSMVLPPDTDTPMRREELLLMPKETRAITGNITMLSARFVAETALRGAARGQFEIIPGAASRLTVWAQRVIPRIVRWFCDRAQAGASR
jgi:3-dehydrosphinganine reductase